MQLPILVHHLENWMPHRPPMVWVDQVDRVEKDSGECSLRIQEDGLYRSLEGIRQSSLIEWVAQSFGYLSAAQVILGMRSQSQQPKQVFLAGLRDARFYDLENEDELNPGRKITIKIEGAREIGPLTLFDGSVLTESGKLIFQVNLKVFAA